MVRGRLTWSFSSVRLRLLAGLAVLLVTGLVAVDADGSALLSTGSAAGSATDLAAPWRQQFLMDQTGFQL